MQAKSTILRKNN